MISQHQIVRLIEAREYRQLTDRILANGRCRSPLARRTLMQPDAAQVAAIGLAIQRVCEMSYRPDASAAGLVHRLLDLQREDGMFKMATGADEPATIAATAVAIRALVTHESLCDGLGLSTGVRINSAICRGLDTLAAAAQHCLAHNRIASPAAWAIVLWQLGDIAEFRNRVSMDALLDLLDATGAELIEDELSRYAHAMAA
jgi:hypothetical protein